MRTPAQDPLHDAAGPRPCVRLDCGDDGDCPHAAVRGLIVGLGLATVLWLVVAVAVALASS